MPEPEVNFLRTVNGGPEVPMDAPGQAQGGVEPDIGAPWTAGVLAVNTPYGPRVVLQLYTLTGTTMVGMEPAGAQKLAAELARKGREARFGLKVIGDAGGDAGEES